MTIEQEKKQTRSERGRKGGLALSQNREHMKMIGSRGGIQIRETRGREYFQMIGSKGGKAKRNARSE